MHDSNRRLTRLLHRLDIFAGERRLDLELDPADPPRQADGAVGRALHRLDVSDVGSIVWATGFRRGYPWLQLPVLDGVGEIRQRQGRTPAAGLFVIGLPGQTRRSSTFLDGVRFDAELVVEAVLEHVVGRTAGRAA